MTLAVLALDRSVSMEMRGWFSAAKECAVVAADWIVSQPDHGVRAVIGFSELASEMAVSDIQEAPFDMSFGRNVMATVDYAQRLLEGAGGRILMFTELEPNAHTLPGQTGPFFSYPPTPETIALTVKQLWAARDDGIAVDAICFDPPSTQEMRRIETAIHQTGGRLIPVTAEDYRTPLAEYLERIWPRRPPRPSAP